MVALKSLLLLLKNVQMNLNIFQIIQQTKRSNDLKSFNKLNVKMFRFSPSKLKMSVIRFEKYGVYKKCGVYVENVRCILRMWGVRVL